MLVHLLDATAGHGPRRPCATSTRSTASSRSSIPRSRKRPQIVVLNKIDLPEVRRKFKTLAAPFKRRGLELLAISAATGEGVPQLLEAAWRILAATPNPIATSGMSTNEPA